MNAYPSPQQDHVGQFQSVQQMEAEERKSATGAPPSSLRIRSIDIRDVRRLRTEAQMARSAPYRTLDADVSARTLEHSAITVGHSRASKPDEVVSICRHSFENASQIPDEQWIKLRASSFPYSYFTKEERRAIANQLHEIIEHALSLGAFVLALYLVLKLRKRDAERPGIVIIGSTVGDMAVGGTVDKRSGGNYVQSLENVNGKIVSSKDIDSIHVQYSPPSEDYYKAAIFVLSPTTRTHSIFPSQHAYLGAESIADILSNLSTTASPDESSRILHLLGIVGPFADTTIGEIAKFGTSANEQVRCVTADVLGDIVSDQSIDNLLTMFDCETSDRVKENILLALLRLDSNTALEGVYRRLACYTPGHLVLELTTRRADDHLIDLFIQGIDGCSAKANPAYMSKFLARIDYTVVAPILLKHLHQSRSEEMRLALVHLIDELGEEYLRHHVPYSFLPSLQELLSDSDVKVAVGAAKGVSTIAAHNNDLEVVVAGLESPHAGVREEMAKQLQRFDTEEAWLALRRLYDREVNVEFRRELEKCLRVHHYTESQQRNQAIAGILEETKSCVIPLVILIMSITGAVAYFWVATSNLGFWELVATTLIGGTMLLSALYLIITLDDELKPIGRRIAIGLTAGLLGGTLLLLLLRYQHESKMVTFNDDFGETTSNQWTVGLIDEFTGTVIKDGELKIAVAEPSTFVFSELQSYRFKDLDLSVICRNRQPAIPTECGVIFGMTDTDNFFRVAVSNQGFVELWNLQSDEWNSIVPRTSSPYIDRGENSIRVVVNGNRVQAYVNSRELIDKQLTALPVEGAVGLAAGSYEDAGVSVGFDEFTLTALDLAP